MDLRSLPKPALHAERGGRWRGPISTISSPATGQAGGKSAREAERFRRFAQSELIARDKVNLDIFWLKDNALDDPDLLPPLDEIADEIVENLEAALDRFRNVAARLQSA